MFRNVEDIDPETGYKGSVKFPESKRDPPFYWVDGDLVPLRDREYFSAPDVRTDFVPMYSIPSPKFDWLLEYGQRQSLRQKDSVRAGKLKRSENSSGHLLPDTARGPEA